MSDAPLSHNTPKAVFAKDYTPPHYLIESVVLDIDLYETATEISATLTIRRNGMVAAPLILNGEGVELLELKLNGQVLSSGAYRLERDQLIIPDVPQSFVLESLCRVNPEANTELSGLYLSGGNFSTQCEAEGFRRITYFLDRPDVMAKYETTLRADKNRYPVLLSNGNLAAVGDDENGRTGRHWARWVDPHPKPSYLFALVAGDLGVLRDQFITASGRHVELAIFAAKPDLSKCYHAMESVKKSMRWDEEVYGREYDLDVYNIVAVSDFNMGAMENKGLNIFNTRYVLASPETATDSDFDGVESVIAHEYFHNWTGNRVTCRDWFQLSLKEGLTVFRDQEFSADQGSRAVKRIEDVRTLRAAQFPEDAGPMAHPVRPDSYIEINNFYTATVYEKGAEVIRMMHALLGPDKFRAGMDLYFERHDGQAVTCDDFVAAMADAGQIDLGHFKTWYSQAGTPKVFARHDYDADQQTLTLSLRQNIPATPGQNDKKPMFIPIRTAFIGTSGAELSVDYGSDSGQVEHMLILDELEKSFVFTEVREAAIPSLLRGFSAPVILDNGLQMSDLAFLARYDTDPFNRWEAFQALASHCALEQIARYQAGQGIHTDQRLIDAVGATLKDQSLDPAYVGEAIVLPSEAILADQMTVADVEAVHQVRQRLRRDIAQALLPHFEKMYQKLAVTSAGGARAHTKGKRKLKNVILGYLAALGRSDFAALAYQQFETARNMTDETAALALLCHTDSDQRHAALDLFYTKWRDDALVLDKWFTVQALSGRDDALAQVMALTGHPDFSRRNPNRLRSLIGAFAHANPLRFHAENGRGYQFLAEEVLMVDKLNPQTAARLLAPLGRWRRMDEGRASQMRAQLQHIADQPNVSKDVFEIASKSLESD